MTSLQDARFLWHHNNNPDDKLIEYRMWVHKFRNTLLPAIATYILLKAVMNDDNDDKDFRDLLNETSIVKIDWFPFQPLMNLLSLWRKHRKKKELKDL